MRSFSSRLLLLPLLAAAVPVAGESPVDGPLAERVRALSGELERVVGRPFDRPVPAFRQNVDEFRDYVLAQIARSAPEERRTASTELLRHLGLVGADEDPETQMLELACAAVAAYYDGDNDRFVFVRESYPTASLTRIILHELQHGMQDQVGPLVDRTLGGEYRTTDDLMGIRLWMEGEAEFATMLYAAAVLEAGGTLPEDFLPSEGLRAGIRRHVTTHAGITYERLARSRGGNGTPELSRWILWGLMIPYFKGPRAAERVWREGGWEAVRAIHDRPPTSSEQVLHPDKLLGERDEPTTIEPLDLTESLGEGWEHVHDDVYGEYALAVLVEHHLGWCLTTNAAATDGWDGDRVDFYRNDDRRALTWRTVWDSPADAREFFEAYRRILETRYPDGTGEVRIPLDDLWGDAPSTSSLYTHRDGDRAHAVALDGDRVRIVEGVDPGRLDTLLDALSR